MSDGVVRIHLAPAADDAASPASSSAAAIVVVPDQVAAVAAAKPKSPAALAEDTLRSAAKANPKYNLTIAFRDLSIAVKVPQEERAFATILSPIADTAKLIATRGASAKTKDFFRVHSCSSVIKPGTMTMILAPPGHGKSSLLKAISGRLPYTGGQLYFNGRTERQAQAEGGHVLKMTQFVDQVDAHLPLLTVRETLDFAHKVSAKVYDPERVNWMIKLLGLEECENTVLGNALIRGVSGGQKRRVTLGEMMMGDACALFLDEYTNGLDTATSEDITRALRKWCIENNSTYRTTGARLPTSPAPLRRLCFLS